MLVGSIKTVLQQQLVSTYTKNKNKNNKNNKKNKNNKMNKNNKNNKNNCSLFIFRQ